MCSAIASRTASDTEVPSARAIASSSLAWSWPSRSVIALRLTSAPSSRFTAEQYSTPRYLVRLVQDILLPCAPHGIPRPRRLWRDRLRDPGYRPGSPASCHEHPACGVRTRRPQASFGGEEFYAGIATKAAVLCSRLVRNHPLPDGNKRAGYLAMREFL